MEKGVVHAVEYVLNLDRGGRERCCRIVLNSDRGGGERCCQRGA